MVAGEWGYAPVPATPAMNAFLETNHAHLASYGLKMSPQPGCGVGPQHRAAAPHPPPHHPPHYQPYPLHSYQTGYLREYGGCGELFPQQPIEQSWDWRGDVHYQGGAPALVPHAHSHAPHAFLRYVRAPPRRDMRCQWLDPEQPPPRKLCNKLFSSMHEIVTASNSRTRGWTGVHDACLLLARLLEERTAVQSEVQASEPHPSAHGRKALSMPLPWMRQGVRQIGKLEDP
ncbi:jg12817 [Pararge aegeria aegeria]|uniref:Jg12817 protein n=1 Tax=Pararge aegeria aegeria TaxID=348720 RepID=A0A8S4RLC8_9NEOP|nr:jg12817 [Pararge aegeria aegeria]